MWFSFSHAWLHLCSSPLHILRAHASSKRGWAVWLTSMRNQDLDIRRRGSEGGTLHLLSLLTSVSPSDSSVLPVSSGWSQTIFAVTRHCTQPLLIFNEGSGPSAVAFWAFNTRVFQWHFCAVTCQAFPEITAETQAFFWSKYRRPGRFNQRFF